MGKNEPLDEKEQKQLIEIMQLFMQLPNRKDLELHFYSSASGCVYKNGKLDEVFHDLEEGVELMRWLANPEQGEEGEIEIEVE